MPRPRARSPTPDIQLPPPQPPSRIVVNKLRRDVRMAVVSQFITVFAEHVNLEFDIEDLEQDLDGTRPLNCVPRVLGKLVNTLANDRNTNATNWMPGLRRAYARRVQSGLLADRGENGNPFVKWDKVRVKDALAAEQASTEGQTTREDVNMREESAVATGEQGEAKASAEASTSAVKLEDGEAVAPADDKMTDGAPSTTLAVGARQDSPEAVAQSAKAEPIAGPSAVAEQAVTGDAQEEEYYDEQVEVDWTEVSLDTKIQAIYDIVQWHMHEPERFRRHLKWEDDLAWRVQPFGYDSASNEYYFLDDNRVWIHRSPPTNRSKLRSNRRATAGPAKGKGKGKAKAVAPRITPKSKAAPAPTTTSRKREAPTTPTSTTRKTKRARRGSVGDEGDDGWEPIPKELMEEWSRSQDDGKNGDKTTGGGGGDGESSTGSALTSLDGASDESKAEVEAESDLSELSELSSEEREDDDDDPDSDANDDGEDTEAQTEMELEELGEDGLLSWERDFWAERKRIEALPNFIEWEAVGVTPKQFEELGQRWSTSKDKDERTLHRRLTKEVIPAAKKAMEDRNAAKLQELIDEYRRQAELLAINETAEEEQARIAIERAAQSERLSRASRHKIHANLSGTDPSAPGRSGPGSDGGSNSGAGSTETREERLKKREDEKRAKEAAAEQAQLEEIRRVERETAMALNGGVVPPGMETPEELEAMRIEREKEERRRAREEARAAKEEAKRVAEEQAKIAKREAAQARAAAKKADAEAAAAARRRKAELNAEAAAQAAAQAQAGALLVPVEEPPWYFACEVCKKEGWNVDDGLALICCDQCEEWQHLECHVANDLTHGRPPVDYAAEDFNFVCSHCRHDPTRRPRAPPPPPPPRRVSSNPKPRKPRTPKDATLTKPLPPKERKPPVARNGSGGPASATAPAKANGAAPAATGKATSVPGPGQPQLSYDELKELIQSQPALIAQLPPQYQQHFSQLLGIPLVPVTGGSTSTSAGI